ncbi:hypothetical protein LTR36_005061 [Oleoguttula mirabilis]|uniref:F-box domain-containing protein n=1 Tax=Oleoguttula mirabilis TaxID=1507867 RepID=A0AAV9JYP6_9PEZI|nr:hypothetical protein LTR36_005061 [Oleoguttula mirabilis]
MTAVQKRRPAPEDDDGDHLVSTPLVRRRSTPHRQSLSKRKGPRQLKRRAALTSNENEPAVDGTEPGGSYTHHHHSATPTRRSFKPNSSDKGLSAPDVVQDSPLLQLPEEIQIHILSFLLIEPNRPIKLQSASDRRWRNEIRRLKDVPPQPYWRMCNTAAPGSGHDKATPRSLKSTLLDVLLVCKPLYFSAIEAFYGGNRLHFDNVDQLRRFTSDMGIGRRRCVKRIEVDMLWFYTARYLPFDGSGEVVLDNVQPGRLDVDALEELPMLREVTIKSVLARSGRVCDWAAGKAQAERNMREAWSSKAEMLQFDWTP